MFRNHLRLWHGMSKIMFNTSSNLLLNHFSKANSKSLGLEELSLFHCGFVTEANAAHRADMQPKQQTVVFTLCRTQRGHKTSNSCKKGENREERGEKKKKTSPQKASSCKFKHDPTRCVIRKHINSDLIAER